MGQLTIAEAAAVSVCPVGHVDIVVKFEESDAESMDQIVNDSVHPWNDSWMPEIKMISVFLEDSSTVALKEGL